MKDQKTLAYINMFAILGKAGYEEERAKLEARMQ
jgi:hypothetical protein